MDIEISETPIQFHLCGLLCTVQNKGYGEVGLKLMNQMWRVVKESQTATTGINHWVYLSDNQMFVGVELLSNSRGPEQLQSMAFELQRHLKHVHVGPYQALPAKWAALKFELAGRGETITSPSLEIYGHHCDDSSKLETTILIGLQPKNIRATFVVRTENTCAGNGSCEDLCDRCRNAAALHSRHSPKCQSIPDGSRTRHSLPSFLCESA